MKKYTALLLAAVIFFMLFTTGCSGSDDDSSSQPPLASNSVIIADDSIPDIAPNVSGTITNISYTREGMTILLENLESKRASGSDTIYVSVTSKTVIEDSNKEKYENMSAISIGDTVSVWFSGNSTGTAPEYAVAQGVRITSRITALSLSISYSNSSIIASPFSGEVTATDAIRSYYGAYMVQSAGDVMDFLFRKVPNNFTATAYPTSADNNEKKARYNLICERDDICKIPENMPRGTYIVNVKANYNDGSEYYVFTLYVR